MSETINNYIEMNRNKDSTTGTGTYMNNTVKITASLSSFSATKRKKCMSSASRSESRAEKPERDCLVFHGVVVDDMERMTGDEDIRKNFLDHNIKNLLKSEWGIECSVPFKHVFR